MKFILGLIILVDLKVAHFAVQHMEFDMLYAPHLMFWGAASAGAASVMLVALLNSRRGI